MFTPTTSPNMFNNGPARVAFIYRSIGLDQPTESAILARAPEESTDDPPGDGRGAGQLVGEIRARRRPPRQRARRRIRGDLSNPPSVRRSLPRRGCAASSGAQLFRTARSEGGSVSDKDSLCELVSPPPPRRNSTWNLWGFLPFTSWRGNRRACSSKYSRGPSMTKPVPVIGDLA